MLSDDPPHERVTTRAGCRGPVAEPSRSPATWLALNRTLTEWPWLDSADEKARYDTEASKPKLTTRGVGNQKPPGPGAPLSGATHSMPDTDMGNGGAVPHNDTQRMDAGMAGVTVDGPQFARVVATRASARRPDSDRTAGPRDSSDSTRPSTRDEHSAASTSAE